MIIDSAKLLSILVEAGSFIASFAAIAAGFVMAGVTKKFGTGILASGFKTNSMGIFFIAAGILLDAVNSYLQLSGFTIDPLIATAILISKEALFVVGTYIIVIGSKKTGDKLESLTK
jgi:hypothetical protein